MKYLLTDDILNSWPHFVIEIYISFLFFFFSFFSFNVERCRRFAQVKVSLKSSTPPAEKNVKSSATLSKLKKTFNSPKDTKSESYSFSRKCQLGVSEV